MLTFRKNALALLAASAFGLAGCDSSGDDGPVGGPTTSGDPATSDDPVTSGTNDGESVAANADGDVVGSPGNPGDTGVSDTATGGGGSGDTSGDVSPVATAASGDDIDLTDEVSRIITADCGALPVLDTAPGASFDAPGTLVEGQPVRAGIDPGVSGNGTHYWQIDLQPGHHHLFVDSRRLDARSGNVGMDIENVEAGGESGARLIRINDVGFRNRAFLFFDNPTVRTMTLAVTPLFAAEDYVIGVFANGRAIPIPFFDDCPDISPLSLGTTEAVELTSPESAEDFVWYRADLPRGRYAIEGTASRVDGADNNIIYRVESWNGFADTAATPSALQVNEVGTVSTDRSTFAHSPAGPVLLRLYGQNAPVNLQFTITPDDE